MRRRSLLGAATALCGQAALAPPSHAAAASPLRWHTAETDRSDPFVSWTIEIMQARYGIRVCRAPGPATADLLTVGIAAQQSPPWRHARLGVLCSGPRAAPRCDAAGLLAWAGAYPGRLAAPCWRAPAGSGLLGQMLAEFAAEPGGHQGKPGAPPVDRLRTWWSQLQPLLWPGRDPDMAGLRAGVFDAMVAVETGAAGAGLQHGSFASAGWMVPFYAMPAPGCRNPAAARALADFLVSPVAQAHAGALRCAARARHRIGGSGLLAAAAALDACPEQRQGFVGARENFGEPYAVRQGQRGAG